MERAVKKEQTLLK